MWEPMLYGAYALVYMRIEAYSELLLRVYFCSWECCRNKYILKKTREYASVVTITEAESPHMASVKVTAEAERLAKKQKKTLYCLDSSPNQGSIESEILPRFRGTEAKGH
ncbi:hypothetical protein LR48_Vigan02g051300 [Vigna angularis]|uniref:Uncharacterized protein n=1 Tax=Phaseolus angularis TaxID=3914 RepID=A0A0L9TUU6_PHAAN|nr:hypothetical protein LR48_Vigan02g051300 [Vigna angularis]